MKKSFQCQNIVVITFYLDYPSSDSIYIKDKDENPQFIFKYIDVKNIENTFI